MTASETATVSSTAYTTSYGCDTSGNIASITYPSGRIVSFGRSADGKVNSITTKLNATAASSTVVSSIDWQPFGDIHNLYYGNGLNLWQTYGEDYRYNEIGVYNGSTALIDRYHGYQDSLNLTNIWDSVDSPKDQSYWYWANNALEDSDGPWGSDSYYQDGVGNLADHTHVSGGTTTDDTLWYGASNNLLNSISRGGTSIRSFTQDADGNRLTDVQGGVTTTYTYNNADRLASFTKGSSLIGTYTYNARGQLVVRAVTNTVPSGVTRYLYDQNGQVLAEYDATSGSLKREYIWLDDKPIAVIDAGATPTVYYVHTDHLSRPIAMTDASKSIVAKYIYTAYGDLYSYTGIKSVDLRFPGATVPGREWLGL